MTAYLVWRGMRLETVGVWRGVSSAVGLMERLDTSMKHCSVETTGMWSIMVQFLFLSISYVSLFAGDYNTSYPCSLVESVRVAVGLWVFGIAHPVDARIYTERRSWCRWRSAAIAERILWSRVVHSRHHYSGSTRLPHLCSSIGHGSVGIAMLLYTFGIYARGTSLWCHRSICSLHVPPLIQY